MMTEDYRDMTSYRLVRHVRRSGVARHLHLQVLFSDHLENVDNKHFRTVGSPFASRQCVFCKSSLFPSDAVKTSNRAEIHTFVALVFYVYPNSFLRKKFNYLRPAFSLIINTTILYGFLSQVVGLNLSSA